MSGKTNSVDFGYLGDKRLETKKGKREAQAQAAGFKGPSAKEQKDVLRREKDERDRRLRQRQKDGGDKVSWKKKFGGMAAVLFLCGAGFFSFVFTVLEFLRGDGVQTLDAKDTAGLKAALFGGDPWLIYCVNSETANKRLPKVLEESARDLHGSIGVRTATLPCWEPTESGRSVAQRFGWGDRKPPLTFLIANGNKPRLVNMVGVSKQEELTKKLLPGVKVSTYKISALKDWTRHCSSRRTCVVIGHKQTAHRDAALAIFKPLAEAHRATRFVTVDTSFWQLKLGDAVLKARPAKEKGKVTRADVVCLVRTGEGKAANFSGTFLQDLDISSSKSFVTACEARESLVPLDIKPKIQARPQKPKVVTPPPRARDPPPPPKPKEKARKVDHVGSREQMERMAEAEPLFEHVEEEEEAAAGREEEEEEEGEDEEVEL